LKKERGVRMATAYAWIDQIFASQIAKRGGVVRRKVSSIDRFSSRPALKRECKRRGYHVVAHGDQWLVFCDKAQVSIVC
jgi:hypothetical protein